jgi:hypothetical protein
MILSSFRFVPFLCSLPYLPGVKIENLPPPQSFTPQQFVVPQLMPPQQPAILSCFPNLSCAIADDPTGVPSSTTTILWLCTCLSIIISSSLRIASSLSSPNNPQYPPQQQQQQQPIQFQQSVYPQQMSPQGQYPRPQGQFILEIRILMTQSRSPKFTRNTFLC